MQINLKISIDFILAKEIKKTYSVLEYAQIVITIQPKKGGKDVKKTK